jgi:hypothetical protein
LDLDTLAKFAAWFELEQKWHDEAMAKVNTPPKQEW